MTMKERKSHTVFPSFFSLTEHHFAVKTSMNKTVDQLTWPSYHDTILSPVREVIITITTYCTQTYPQNLGLRVQIHMVLTFSKYVQSWNSFTVMKGWHNRFLFTRILLTVNAAICRHLKCQKFMILVAWSMQGRNPICVM